MTWVEELRHGARRATRHWRLSLFIALSLSVAIAIPSIAAFFIEAAYSGTLPYRAPEQLVQLEFPLAGVPGNAAYGVSPANIADIAHQTKTLRSIGVAAAVPSQVSTPLGVMSLPHAAVSGSLFSTLGVRPELGRLIDAGDDNASANPVVVLSYRIWKSDFGADSGIVGKNIRVDDVLHTVIGIAPPRFDYPQSDLWTALAHMEPPRDMRAERWYWAMGRLRDGATAADAARELETIAHRLAVQYPKVNHGFHATAEPIRQFSLTAAAGLLRVFLIVITGLIFLAGVGNSAGLMVAQSLRRRQETGIRIALGADRWRIVKLMLAEMAVIAGVAECVALIAAVVTTAALNHWLAGRLPDWIVLRLNFRGFVFLTALTACATVVCAVLPALATFPDLRRSTPGSLPGGGPARLRWPYRLMLSVQFGSVFAFGLIAITTMSDAALRWRTLARIGDEHVVVAKFHRRAAVIPVASMRPALDEKLVAMADVPGATRSSWISTIELYKLSSVMANGTSVPTDDGSYYTSMLIGIAGTGYPAASGVHVISGRMYDAAEMRSEAPVAVLNATAQKLLFGNGYTGGGVIAFANGDQKFRLNVVGVVDDALPWVHPAREPAPLILSPQFQLLALGPNVPTVSVVIRSTDPARTAQVLRAGKDLDMGLLSLDSVDPMSQLISDGFSGRRRTIGLMLALTGIVGALVIAGLLGALRYETARRRQEFGIRMAMGARTASLLRMRAAEQLRMDLLGIFFGAYLAWGIVLFIKSFGQILPGIQLPDVLLGALVFTGISQAAGFIVLKAELKSSPATLIGKVT